MIRSDKIKTALVGGVGFRNPTDSEFNIVNEANQVTSSGLYFQDASNFVTIRNIKDCQGDSNITNAEFNTYLTNLKYQVIDDVVRSVIGDKSRMLYNANLYPYEKDFSETLTPGTGFVGFEIEPYMRKASTMKVEWVELCFDSDVTFTVYLFNSNLRTAIKSEEVTTSANEAKIVDLTDWFLDDDTNYKGGKYYLGYFESDLGTAKPIKRDHENSTLNVSNSFYFINPVRVTQTSNILDVTSTDSLSDTAGLNIGVAIYRDFTQRVIENRHLFYPVIQFGMAVKVLDIIRTSIRSNLTQRLTSEMIQSVEFELYGNAELRIEGVKGKYLERLQALKRLIFDEPLMTISTLR